MTDTEDTTAPEETVPTEDRTVRPAPRHTWSAKGASAVELYRRTLELQRDLDQARREWEQAVYDMPTEDMQGYHLRTSKIRDELLSGVPVEPAEGGDPDGEAVQG